MKNKRISILAAGFLTFMMVATGWAAGAAHLKNHPDTPTANPAWVEGNLLVKMKPGRSATALERRLSSLTAGRTGTGRDGHTIKRFRSLNTKRGAGDLLLLKCPGVATQKLLEAFARHPDVETAEPDYIIRIDAVPDDAAFDQLWALENTGQEVDGVTGTENADIDAPGAWDHLTGNDPRVVVAVIDTGVDYTHGDMAANMWTNTAELDGTDGVDDDGNGYVDDIYGIDAANGDCDPYDDNRHGTHVAGTIAAVTDNGEGVAGITWNTARIMALKFLSANGRGATSGAVECIDYLLAMNRRPENDIVVMNASWGSTSPGEALKAALETAAHAGVIMSAAAGNSTNDCDGNQKHYPSCLDVPNVISVAATDQNDRLASFSNYGASEVDIAAPGVDILSTVPGGGYDAISTDPFYDSMEDGGVLWDPERTDGQWAISDENAFHKDMAWSDSPGGNYAFGELGTEYNFSLVSLPVDLSGQVDENGDPKALMLGFWLYKDLLPDTTACGKRDTLHVEVSGDDGQTWTPLAAHTGSDPDWKSYAYAIPAALVTDSVRIRFRMDIWPNGSADGVYLDKVGIGEANALGAFKFFNGTSMAAPHVSGALALMAALYPEETMDERISRLYAGADRIDTLKGCVATDARLNLAGSVQPDLPTCPLIHSFEMTGKRDLQINGAFFGDTPGRVMFHDACAPDTGVDGTILSWSDTGVTVEKPPWSGGYFYVIDANNARSGRRPMKVSLWEAKTPSDTKRDSATACRVGNKIYTFGGYAGGNNALRGWEIYSLDSDSWEYPYGQWMPEFSAHLTSAVLDGRIYLIGGYTTRSDGATLDTVTRFDPNDRSFTPAESLPVAACFSRAVTAGNRIYVTGGLDGNDLPLNSVLSFDPQRPTGRQWQVEATHMSRARFAHGAVALDGRIYVFGGLESWTDDEIYTATGEILDTATGTRLPMAPMPIALARFGTACDGRYIYVVGGTNNDFWRTPKDTVLRYDTATDTWSSLPDRQLARAKLAAPAIFVPGHGLFSPNGGFINTDEAGGMFGPPFQAMDELAFLDVTAMDDADGDLIPDMDDNCRLTANSGQQDSDADGYGDRCDCDLTNDGSVNMADFMQFRGYWGTCEPLADFNGDGAVNQADFMIFRGRWGTEAPFE